jgi:hypothetical protein
VERPLARTIYPTLQTAVPLLLLHNLDHAWPQYDIDQALMMADMMIESMQAEGHPLMLGRLEDDNLTELLSQFDPNEVVVFNWCEEVPGVPRSAWMVAKELERQGFTYTGADYPALVLSQDKRQIQQRLRDAKVSTPVWKVYCSASEVTGWDLFPAIVKPAFEHDSLGIERESVV